MFGGLGASCECIWRCTWTSAQRIAGTVGLLQLYGPCLALAGAPLTLPCLCRRSPATARAAVPRAASTTTSSPRPGGYCPEGSTLSLELHRSSGAVEFLHCFGGGVCEAPLANVFSGSELGRAGEAGAMFNNQPRQSEKASLHRSHRMMEPSQTAVIYQRTSCQTLLWLKVGEAAGDDGGSVAACDEAPAGERPSVSPAGGPQVEPLPQPLCPLAPPALGPMSGGPAPAAPASVATMGDRGDADAVVVVPGGKISYYKKNCRFEAVCSQHPKERCRLTRTSKGPTRANLEGQGRPVGLLAAWLAAGVHAEVNSAEVHRGGLLVCLITRAQRIEGRAAVGADPNLAALMSFERPQGADPDPEPERVPDPRF